MKTYKKKVFFEDLECVTNEAIQFIVEHEPVDGYFVGFSGGKDSIVTLELVKMSGVKYVAYYSYTGIDPPELVKFIRKYYSNVQFLYPKYSFWNGIAKHMPPLRTARWCCNVLKKDSTKAIKLKHRIMGLRAEESSMRAGRPRVEEYRNTNWIIYKPIFNWLEWHVWDFIDEHGLPYPSLYDDGISRIGCVICPFLSRKKMEEHRKRWPKFYKTFEHAVSKWFSSRKEDSYPMLQRLNITTLQQYLEFWYRKQEKGFKGQDECCKARSPFEEDD